MKQYLKKWRLYVITDEVLSRGRSHAEIAEAAITGGADIIQLRDKTASSQKLYKAACDIRKLTQKAGVSFVVNDRLDIALAVDADGLHVGQDDLPASVARRLLKSGMILGVSATSLEEAIQAEKDGADYLGVGPVFEARGTKPDAGEPLGLELIQNVLQECSLPIVAIGGINNSNVGKAIHSGAHCAAVISAIVSAQNVIQATRDIKQTIIATKKGME